MRTRSIRRLLAGLGVVGLVVAVAASPGAAAPEPADVRPAVAFDLYANNVALAPGGPKKSVDLTVLGDRPLPSATVTVDRSGVDGFATVAPSGGDCSAAGPVLTCQVLDEDGPSMGLLSLVVSLRENAEAGQRGELAFTVTEPGGGRSTFRSTVSVGAGVDLVAPAEAALTGRPGATVTAPLTVRNQGERAVEQLVLYVVGNYSLAPAKRYRNCEYFATGPHHSTPVTFACTFDRSLAPGAAVRVDSDFSFALPRDSWAPNTQHGTAVWLTPADWAALRSQRSPANQDGERGTDGVLGLASVSAAPQRAGEPQSELTPGDNSTEIVLTVQGDQQADAAANGARVSGEVGRTVPVTVGYTNKGPAVLNAGGRSFYTIVAVLVPEGTTAVRAPKNCRSDEDQGEEPGRPGGRHYSCFRTGPLPSGERAEFPFSLRIDKPGRHSSTITLGHNGSTVPVDLDPGNDTAKIVVDTAAQGGGDGDDDGGQGGGLPITGASVVTIAAIGGGLLLVGAALFFFTRRRQP
ncbi:LPXTG cell wall anchor domain-containing protein [Micromonospora yangpuensis]|uniref:LPXTG-motif cell wall anchor domain-containing protein n=1 Tax=Micromonospora yangpuensis TaxID=683228 RepID=A0A1C6TY43_9ACTN|nr:LPXTG cell wall anchor domain-containing protein [Micromonospora yangpuensis]SCL46541.1 LPXTG-motif cell wall anchor domain-containing protein [Micromonospora yangpuensis]